MSNKTQVALSVAVVAAAVVVVTLMSGDDLPPETGEAEGAHDHAAMAAGGEARPVRLSQEAARRIGVTLATAELRSLEWGVEAVGTVTYDETRLATVSPKIEGWVEELEVDFTGAPVERGQPLMRIYSPQLVSAQEELVLAARLARDAVGDRASQNARELLESARRRLDYWDIPEDDVQRIEESGEVTKTLTLRAPASGIVVEKSVVPGDRIVPGTVVYRIADLSLVWIEADVFEKDLGLVREGQAARVHFETYPGREFLARVTYVYPTVSLDARTGRVRLELANPALELKPGMYAHIDLEVEPSAPSVVVPSSAVLATGERALVFVEAADGALTPREVVPGRTSGRSVELLSGVAAGERVVSSAAFLVDAESKLGVLADEAVVDTSVMDHSEHDMTGTPMEPGMGAPARDSVPEGSHEGHTPPPDPLQHH